MKQTYTRCKTPWFLTLAYNAEILCINHGDQRVFQFEIIMKVAISVSFEYLCYGSTADINILILSERGPSLYVRI